MLLESFPYRVIEGMAIAARAVGAHEGHLLHPRRVPAGRAADPRGASRAAEERGLLGDAILGSDFRLRLSVKEGAGAFVCGEETALIASLEGRRGMPRLRPPYPAESGLWGKPTLINNVETSPWCPGSSATAPRRSPRSAPRRARAPRSSPWPARSRRGGLIEVPMGITLREIVEEIGGGVAGGRRFKAVQVGGPSGGCVPAELADTPVDYEALRRGRRDHGHRRAGRARRHRLHGRHRPLLPPLHPGPVVRQVHVLPHRHPADARDPGPHLHAATGRRGDLEELEQLAPHGRPGSLCGLGKTAPNPVLSTLRYFREEYEAHLDGPLPGRQVQGPDRLPDHRRLHRLHALRPALPGRRDPDDALPPAPDRHGEMHPLRHLPPGLPEAARVGVTIAR